MSVSSIGEQAFGAYRGSVDFFQARCSDAGRVFTVLSEDVANPETTIMFGRVVDVFIKAKEALGFGEISLSEKSYQNALDSLDVWNSVMTFPGAVKASVEKVAKFFLEQSFILAADCVSTLTGTFNGACDVVGFVENQLAISSFKGLSETLKVSNFQALATGATARVALSAEKMFSSIAVKKDYKGGVEGGLGVAKNLGDLTFAVGMLVDGGKQVLLGGSALSAASRVGQYALSKMV